MQRLKVKVKYPTDSEVLSMLNERVAKALAIAYSNKLPPEKFDELITKLSKEVHGT